MFENANTVWIEILVLVAVALFLLTLFSVYVYKKAHNIPTGECACCHTSGKRLVKQYHKCCCNKK